jgi:hypothetical protein
MIDFPHVTTPLVGLALALAIALLVGGARFPAGAWTVPRRVGVGVWQTTRRSPAGCSRS